MALSGAPIAADEMRRCAAIAHDGGLRVHVDGARIWNAAIALGARAARARRRRRHGDVLPVEGPRRAGRLGAVRAGRRDRRGARAALAARRRDAPGRRDRRGRHRRARDDGRAPRRRPRAGAPARGRARGPLARAASIPPPCAPTSCAPTLDALPADFVERLDALGVRAGTIDPRTVRFVTHKDVDDDAIAAHDAALRRAARRALTLLDETPATRARDLRAPRRSRDLGRRHARPLGRRRRRGARRRHDPRRQGHQRSRRRPRRARPAAGRGDRGRGAGARRRGAPPSRPSRRRARRRPGAAARAGAARPDGAARRGVLPRSDRGVLRRRVRQPSRPPHHRLGDARRGRARGGQPALLPRADRAEGLDVAPGARALPLGHVRAERVGRHRRHARTQDRGVVLPREPARRDRRLVPRVPARERRSRRAVRRACSYAEAFRRIALA